MIGRGKSGLLLPAVLLVAGGAAAWATYSWLRVPGNASPAEGVVEAESSEIVTLGEELAFSMPPIGAYDAILKRPIFAPNRRAVAGPTAAVVVNQELGVELLGFVGEETDIRILLKPSDGGEAINLREGEDYRGWTFIGIDEGKVVFSNDAGEEETLELDYEKAPTPTAKSRRDRRRKQAQQAEKAKQKQQVEVIEEEEEEAEEAEQGDQGQ